jgi:hypothetical protein
MFWRQELVEARQIGLHNERECLTVERVALSLSAAFFTSLLIV